MLTFKIARVTNKDGTSLPKVIKRSSHNNNGQKEKRIVNESMDTFKYKTMSREVPTSTSFLTCILSAVLFFLIYIDMPLTVDIRGAHNALLSWS